MTYEMIKEAVNLASMAHGVKGMMSGAAKNQRNLRIAQGVGGALGAGTFALGANKFINSKIDRATKKNA